MDRRLDEGELAILSERLIALCELALVTPDRYRQDFSLVSEENWDLIKTAATEQINGRG